MVKQRNHSKARLAGSAIFGSILSVGYQMYHSTARLAESANFGTIFSEPSVVPHYSQTCSKYHDWPYFVVVRFNYFVRLAGSTIFGPILSVGNQMYHIQYSQIGTKCHFSPYFVRLAESATSAHTCQWATKHQMYRGTVRLENVQCLPLVS